MTDQEKHDAELLAHLDNVLGFARQIPVTPVYTSTTAREVREARFSAISNDIQQLIGSQHEKDE